MPPDTTQTSPRHPQGIPSEHNMPTDANRRQQTLPDTQNHWQVLFEYVWWCLLAFVVVCWHVVFPGAVWGSLGNVWVVSGHLSGVNGNQRHSDAFGVYLVSLSLQYGAKILIWQSPKWCDFLSFDHTETFLYQNLPMCPFQKWLSYAFLCIS